MSQGGIIEVCMQLLCHHWPGLAGKEGWLLLRVLSMCVLQGRGPCRRGWLLAWARGMKGSLLLLLSQEVNMVLILMCGCLLLPSRLDFMCSLQGLQFVVQADCGRV